MFSCKFHCSSYFLINAINKAVANHLMQRQQDNSHWRFPLLSMILSLELILFAWTTQKSLISSLLILEWTPLRVYDVLIMTITVYQTFPRFSSPHILCMYLFLVEYLCLWYIYFKYLIVHLLSIQVARMKGH